MLDHDLADLYGVETGALVRAMKRNSDRFPEDFAFQLSVEEWDNLRCQFGISSEAHGGRRFVPYVFTEQGVAMLSSVLRSGRAVAVNIEIMRTFVALRRVVEVRDALRRKLDELEKHAELVSNEALNRLAALGGAMRCPWAYPARPTRPKRSPRGASARPDRLPHYQCAFTARPTPGIHGSTSSSAHP